MHRTIIILQYRIANNTCSIVITMRSKFALCSARAAIFNMSCAHIHRRIRLQRAQNEWFCGVGWGSKVERKLLFCVRAANYKMHTYMLGAIFK